MLGYNQSVHGFGTRRQADRGGGGAAGVMRSANCGMMRNRRSKIETIALHTVGLGPREAAAHAL